MLFFKLIIFSQNFLGFCQKNKKEVPCFYTGRLFLIAHLFPTDTSSFKKNPNKQKTQAIFMF